MAKKNIAEYMEEPEEKEVKVEVKADKDFGDMRLIHLFEKAFDPGFGPSDGDDTHIDRVMKRLEAFKKLIAACK